MAGFTDKQVKIKFSSLGGAKATDTSNNGDVIFDGRNKYIYARGETFDCRTLYNQIDSHFTDGTKVATITPVGKTDSSSGIWIPTMSSKQLGLAKVGFTSSGVQRAVQIDANGALYIEQAISDVSISTGETDTIFNSETTNGNTFIKITDSGIFKAQIKITGSGATSVTSDSNGAITVDSTDTWEANTKDSSGYVSPGNGQSKKVWKTDENGNPGWRDEEGTRNTAGSTQSDTKLYLIGTESQTDYTQTYSNSKCYIDGSSLYSDGAKVAKQSELLAYIPIDEFENFLEAYLDYSQNDKNYPVQLGGDAENLYVNVPWEDTHYSTGIQVGATGTATSGTTTNGNTYIKVTDDDTYSSQIKIIGDGGTTVSSAKTGDVGVITISSSSYSDFVKSGSGAASGLVPKPSTTAGTSKYLCENGEWVTPPNDNTEYSDFVKSGSGAASGLVPKPSTTAGTSKYLCENGEWDVPEGTTYETFGASGANAKSGLVPSPGTTAGTAKYLREDGTWQTPPNDHGSTYEVFGGSDEATPSDGLVPKPSKNTTAKYTLFLREDGTWQVPDTAAIYSVFGGSDEATPSDGLVPAPNANAGTKTKYLREDGTWQTPPDNNTEYSDFVKSGANAASGLVPKPSTTAGTSKYLREDGTWQTPPDNNDDTWIANALNVAGYVAAPSSSDSNKVWRTDIDGKPFWGNLLDSDTAAFKGSDQETPESGLVPAPNANATKNYTLFLREDGQWAVPTSGTEVETYSVFVGSNGTAPTDGLVPKPTKRQTGTAVKFLREDATWAEPAFETYDVFVKSGSTAASGLVPSPGTTAGTSKYLCEDGTWSTPPDNNTEYSDFVKSGSTAASGLVPKPSTTAGSTKYLCENGTWSTPPNDNTEYDVFVKSGSNAASGLVPKPSTTAGTSKYLCEDGTWSTPPDVSVSSINGLSGGTLTSALTVQGNITATAFYETSDKSLKENIQDISTYDDMLNVREFNWKSTGDKSYGFIAQEVEINYPELVTINDEGLKVVNYDSALALMVGKLLKKIEKLEVEIQELKSK